MEANNCYKKSNVIFIVIESLTAMMLSKVRVKSQVLRRVFRQSLVLGTMVYGIAQPVFAETWEQPKQESVWTGSAPEFAAPTGDDPELHTILLAPGTNDYDSLQLVVPVMADTQLVKSIEIKLAEVGDYPLSKPRLGQDFKKRWFLMLGMTNYFTKLHDSESAIDELDATAKAIMPNWDRPYTFADQRDDLMLADFWIGLGRDIHPEFAWFMSVGGGYGEIGPGSKAGNTFVELLK